MKDVFQRRGITVEIIMNMNINSIIVMRDTMKMVMVYKSVSVGRVVVQRINIIHRSIKHNHKSLDMEDGELHIEESDGEMTIQRMKMRRRKKMNRRRKGHR